MSFTLIHYQILDTLYSYEAGRQSFRFTCPHQSHCITIMDIKRFTHCFQYLFPSYNNVIRIKCSQIP